MGKLRAATVHASGLGRVIAVHDPEAADIQGVPVLATAEAVIAEPGVEAVFICTPNFRNFPLTIAALRAGKHVFCEKPPAFTSVEVQQVMAEEARTGLKVMYGFNHRHHGSIKAMKAHMDSGEYGRLLWMRGRYGKSVDHTYFDTWRAKKELAGGGILFDQGIHMLDLFLLLAGEFDEVQAMVSNLYWKLDGIEDNVFANFRNRRTGVVASLHSTMTQWRHLFSLEVFLERGHIVLNGLKTQSGTYGDEELSVARNRAVAPAVAWGEEKKTVFHVDTSWADETNAFLVAVKENRPIESGNSMDALRVMRLVERVYQTERHEHADLHRRLR
jgi:1,5-anhydro-D-fructose reductase (1,5-anhydro-D-mannitol-forming)